MLEDHCDVRPVAFQDDTYLLGDSARVAAGLRTLEPQLRVLGLKINWKKFQIYAPTPEALHNMPHAWEGCVVPSLEILGNRLHIRLHTESFD